MRRVLRHEAFDIVQTLPRRGRRLSILIQKRAKAVELPFFGGLRLALRRGLVADELLEPLVFRGDGRTLLPLVAEGGFQLLDLGFGACQTRTELLLDAGGLTHRLGRVLLGEDFREFPLADVAARFRKRRLVALRPLEQVFLIGPVGVQVVVGGVLQETRQLEAGRGVRGVLGAHAAKALDGLLEPAGLVVGHRGAIRRARAVVIETPSPLTRRQAREGENRQHCRDCPHEKPPVLRLHARRPCVCRLAPSRGGSTAGASGRAR